MHEEVVILDEYIETMAHILTLIMARLNPKINKGETYSILVGLIVQMIDEPLNPEDIEECADDLSTEILAIPTTTYNN